VVVLESLETLLKLLSLLRKEKCDGASNKARQIVILVEEWLGVLLHCTFLDDCQKLALASCARRTLNFDSALGINLVLTKLLFKQTNLLF
jgi:hypothetical protein